MITVKTYRGHIRNWKELCEELAVDAALPREEKEQEILVKAYQKWGGEMADHIYGMFAFALWDEEEKKLFCLRDQFGTKPFYYYQTEDGELLYGTMIRDIIGQPGFKKELNEEMLQIYMSLTYGAGEDTFFKGLKKLLPGRYLIWKDGKVEIHRYWTPKFQPDESKSLEDWADEIHSTLKSIMPEVKTEDETVESFLSSGVDSSYVLAMSDAKMSDSCGYDEERFDESRLAKKTAELLRREHSVCKITPQQYFDIVPYVMYNMEQPLGDASANIMKEDEKKKILKHYNPEVLPINLTHEIYKETEGLDPLTKMSDVDIQIWLEGDIYLNVDKMSTAAGLEIRMPLTDRRIFDIASRMPSRFKVNEEQNKVAFRTAAAKVLPEEIAFRKKLGFIVPIRIWMADARYNQDVQRLFHSEIAEKFFNVDAINEIFDDYVGGNSDNWRKVWTIYTFLVWYEEYFVKR